MGVCSPAHIYPQRISCSHWLGWGLIMCGRYTLTAGNSEIVRRFGLESVPEVRPRYNISPGQPIAVVRENPYLGSRECTFLNWGLVPFWANEPTIGMRLINARAESAAGKPAFRGPMRHHRCLIPANGFYEWKHGQPYYFSPNDGALFAFAGVFDHWAHADGSEIESCAILTTAANKLVATVHKRMPVIIQADDYAAWLDIEQQRPAKLNHLLTAWDASGWRVHPVGRGVNKTGTEGADLIEKSHPHANGQTNFLGALGITED